jgi:hypothetical protein
MPQPPLRACVAGIPVMVLLTLALLAGGAVLLKWYRSSHRGSHPGRAVLVGVLGLGRGASYRLPAGSKLVPAPLSWVERGLGGSEAGWLARPRAVVARGLSPATVCLLVAFPARVSPFLHRYHDWDESAVRSREFLSELDRRVENAAVGTAIPSPPIPRWVKVQPEAVAVRGAALFSSVTMEAYFELAYPPRVVRMAQRPGQVPRPREVLVIPTGLAPGFDGP